MSRDRAAPAPLPIDGHLERIVETVRSHRAVVVVAPPGSGKTTRVPPALAVDGSTLLLQPRRVAARALARRIASERGWRLGHEVGWQVRLERRFTPDTRLLVATEGILTARLQSDPLLSDFTTVVLDEFHERSLHADLALALVRQALEARDDLRLAVMSATLDAGPVAGYLGGCPVIELPGRPFPVEVRHAPGIPAVRAVEEALPSSTGHLLCFLPGAPEIRRVADGLRSRLPQLPIFPLHGSLDADSQDAAIATSERRKLILATNIAETSLTVDGVGCVVDTGLHKVLRRDPGTGIDRLEVERISLDSAEQRTGRAGRTGPGVAIRLWDPREEFRAHREPEILRVDLSAPLLDLLAWGGDPFTFEWFQAPPEDATRAALELLQMLGAVAAGRITDLGREMRRLPLHPRLARLLLAAGGSHQAAAACAALSEGWRPAGDAPTTRSDLLVAADRIDDAPRRVRRVAVDLARSVVTKEDADENRFLRAVLVGYPDRVARRRERGSNRLLLAGGHGAVQSAESGVRDAGFLVAVETIGGRRGPGSEARVRMASAVDPAWLAPTRIETRHLLERSSGSVRATRTEYHGALVLSERAARPDPGDSLELLVEEMQERGLDGESAALFRRLEFAGVEIDLDGLFRQACAGRTSLPDFRLGNQITYESRREVERLAPESIVVPSGRRVRLDYRKDRTVFASVKLQELFGLADTPTVGRDRTPVTFSLLAPNGRPVQTTRDLRSFWDHTYREVRKQLRGRYPKHPWPEDPWTARPTAKTKRRC